MSRVSLSTFRLAIFLAADATGFGMERVEAAEGMAEVMESLALPSHDFTLSRKGICCAVDRAGRARRRIEGRILRLETSMALWY